MIATALRDCVISALEDLKGQEILTLDVAQLTSITDYMVLVNGTSSRHVKALVDEVLEQAKAAGQTALGVEGREAHEWVLIDLGDVLVHVMQAEAREFYELERLWADMPADQGNTSE